MSGYREIGRLAEGGMAIIAQAERDDGTTVVIKRVRPPFCFDQSFLRLFADEGSVHAALDHENIVRLLDRGEDAAGPFLVFEHVDGTDLAAVLERQWCRPPEESRGLDVECVLAVAIPLCRALAAAHEAKDKDGVPLCVVHRDISPGNILIAQDGTIKLADFGVASFALKNEVTVAGEMKGKFAYMAPEQTRGEKVDPRADLFAAGVVLWECLTGRRLFDGPTDADVVAAVRNAPAPALEVLRPGLSPALSKLIAELLAKDPAERPASARDVERRFKDIAIDLGFDEGLARQSARLARTAPRRALTPTLAAELDARRRTQRVFDATAAGGLAVRPTRARSIAPAAALVGVVVVVAIAALGTRSKDEVVTALPPSPGPVPAAPKLAVAAIAPVVTLPSPAAAETNHVAALPPKVERLAGRTGDPKPEAKPITRPAVETQPVLKATAAPVVAGFGKLTITTEPWASVTIDGKVAVKETPLRALSLPAGHHVILLENPYYRLSKSVELDVPADGDVKKFFDLNAP